MRVPQEPQSNPDESVELEGDYKTGVGFAPGRLGEVDAVARELGSIEELARTRPDLCVPHIELDQPDLARTQFMLDSRPPTPGEVPDWMLVDYEGLPLSIPVRVLEDADLWVRPAPDRSAAWLMLRSRRMYSLVSGVLVGLHAKNDAQAIEAMRSRGNDFKNAYDFPMKIDAWTVPIWRDVAKAKRWVSFHLSANGEGVAALLVNGANVIVEV
ncbi:MAG: hypothetical protein ACLQT7_07615 [Candidatus Dormibacteria bacterium]